MGEFRNAAVAHKLNHSAPISVSIVMFLALYCLPVLPQDSLLLNQAWCAKKAEVNMQATKRESPEIAATILTFLYEYSPHHHACVAVMEYKTQKDGRPYAQILARNLVTLQPMKGLGEIYLLPMENKQDRIDTINFLFDKYSK